MRTFVSHISLAAALCAVPATLSFAQGAGGGAGGSAGTSSPGTAGVTSPSTRTNSIGSTNFGSTTNAGGTAGSLPLPYANPLANPGALFSSTSSSSPLASSPGANGGRLNGSGVNTPAAPAGDTCGLSLTDPTSGVPMPLTQPLSARPTAGGCE